MDGTITRLLGELAGARTFEDAAAALLGAALDVTEASFRAARHERGQILRAMAHLRPDDAYVSLVAIDVLPRGGREPLRRGTSAHVPSATAWRWVKEHGRPVAVDVTLGEVTVAGTANGPGSGGDVAATIPTQKLDAKRSQAVLIERNVTHLYVVPLRAPLGQIDGMLAIEASCQAAMGEPFIWPACGPKLEGLAAIAAPYLSRLPVAAAEPTPPDDMLPVIGRSMHPVIEMLRVFASQEETILLGGPTGSGKTRLARWCHERSQVKSGPFEVMDLARLPEELQMGELFGWRKGAFTNALKDTPGHIANAEGGTLFIDEIDKLSLRAQSGLLRVLEEKKYRPLGDGAGDRSANVRFIIGTNADLFALSRKGEFREDLYYRVNVLPVRIPGLADRRDEISDWAAYMLRRHTDQPGASLSRDAAQLLTAHDWPGNLRQLDNIVRRAYALSLVFPGSERGGSTLGADEVRRALEYEGTTTTHPVWTNLERAADAFAHEAQRRVADGEPKLDMDVAEAFKAIVIEAARRQAGGDGNKDSLRTAYVTLGKESVVESRNHVAHYRREMDKLDGAREALKLPPRSKGKSGS